MPLRDAFNSTWTGGIDGVSTFAEIYREGGDKVLQPGRKYLRAHEETYKIILKKLYAIERCPQFNLNRRYRWSLSLCREMQYQVDISINLHEGNLQSHSE